MKLILARHGNTFKPGEPVVCVGSRNDLPLVASGIAQAENLAKTLKIMPRAIYCSPLQRTQHYAKIIIERNGWALEPIIDDRLNEIDYGDWSGLTHDQIRSRFGETLEAWEKRSEWPLNAHWGNSEEKHIEQIHAFCNDLLKHYHQEDTLLLISSNGCLRYFLTLIPGEFKRHLDAHTFKMATGNISQFHYSHAQWQLDYWNQTPYESNDVY